MTAGLAVPLASGKGAGGGEDVGAPGGFELEEAAAAGLVSPLATTADAGEGEFEDVGKVAAANFA